MSTSPPPTSSSHQQVEEDSLKPTSSSSLGGDSERRRHPNYHRPSSSHRGDTPLIMRSSSGRDSAGQHYQGGNARPPMTRDDSSNSFFQHLAHRWLPSEQATTRRRDFISIDDSEMTAASEHTYHTAAGGGHSVVEGTEPSFPHSLELPSRKQRRCHRNKVRSWKRRFFLLLTEPQTSYASAVFFFIMIVAISLANIIGIMQTMEYWQFIPDDCISCGG